MGTAKITYHELPLSDPMGYAIIPERKTSFHNEESLARPFENSPEIPMLKVKTEIYSDMNPFPDAVVPYMPSSPQFEPKVDNWNSWFNSNFNQALQVRLKNREVRAPFHAE